MLPELVEIIPIADIYVDEVGGIEILGSNVRVTYVTRERGQAVVVAKIVRPIASIHGRLRHMITEATIKAAAKEPPALFH